MENKPEYIRQTSGQSDSNLIALLTKWSHIVYNVIEIPFISYPTGDKKFNINDYKVVIIACKRLIAKKVAFPLNILYYPTEIELKLELKPYTEATHDCNKKLLKQKIEKGFYLLIMIQNGAIGIKCDCEETGYPLSHFLKPIFLGLGNTFYRSTNFYLRKKIKEEADFQILSDKIIIFSEGVISKFLTPKIKQKNTFYFDDRDLKLNKNIILLKKEELKTHNVNPKNSFVKYINELTKKNLSKVIYKLIYCFKEYIVNLEVFPLVLEYNFRIKEERNKIKLVNIYNKYKIFGGSEIKILQTYFYLINFTIKNNRLWKLIKYSFTIRDLKYIYLSQKRSRNKWIALVERINNLQLLLLSFNLEIPKYLKLIFGKIFRKKLNKWFSLVSTNMDLNGETKRSLKEKTNLGFNHVSQFKMCLRSENCKFISYNLAL